MPKLDYDDEPTSTPVEPKDVNQEDLQGVEMAKAVVRSMLRMVRVESFKPEFEDLFDQVEQIIKRRK